MRVLIPTSLLALFLLTACAQHWDPAVAIEANVNAMETALAELDKNGFMEHLSESFNGGESDKAKLGKEEAEKMLAVYFLRYRKVHILVTQLEIEPDLYEPALATSSATVALSGGEHLVPNSAGLYKVTGQWQNFDGTWKLTRLEWE